MKKYNFIYIALARWDGPYASTAWAIAQELAVEHNVFYIENPYTLKDMAANFTKKYMRKRMLALIFGLSKYHKPFKNKNLIVVTPMVILPINWLKNNSIYRLLNRLNNSLMYLCIKQTISKYKLDSYISFNSFNPFYGLFFPEKFNPTQRIYQSVDAIEQSAYLQKHGTYWENEYVKCSDFTITTSSKLKEKLQAFNNNVHLVPNAADISLFKTVRYKSFNLPDDIKHIGSEKKVIGYIGNICHRIDYALLLKIAKQYSNCILLMVGPLNTENAMLKELKSLKNVIFTGAKPLNELPDYLHRFNCGLIPFLSNKLTASIYPLKINEYLAAGLQVVSTAFSNDIRDFKSIIFLSETADSFVNNIEHALIKPDREWLRKSLLFVSNNTWGNRAEQLTQLINNYTNHAN